MINGLQRELAIIRELGTSIKLIELGIREYQNLGEVNQFYYLPFQLISSGLERLMKCHICLGHLEQNKKFPDFKYIKDLGHDLVILKKHLTDNFYSINQRSALKSDLNYIENDLDLEEIIRLLTKFGKQGRYHNLNIITNSSKSSIDIQSEWEHFEMELIKRDNHIIEEFDDSKDINEAINKIIVIHIEKFTRAICRQFTLGDLGEKAMQLSPILADFIHLDDKELGSKEY